MSTRSAFTTRQQYSSGGFIVTNPNCSTIMLALALAPLHATFGVSAVAATTLQALSGAGYPGVSSLDIVDNVLPYIASEEEKIETETTKILGHLAEDRIEPASMAVSAQCHRVNVADGHMAAVRVKLSRQAELSELREALASFSSMPQVSWTYIQRRQTPIVVRDEPDRPQPKLDRDAGQGMTVTIGRLMPDSVLDYRFVALSHNTIRGAAGAAILNAELLAALGHLKLSDEKTCRSLFIPVTRQHFHSSTVIGRSGKTDRRILQGQG